MAVLRNGISGDLMDRLRRFPTPPLERLPLVLDVMGGDGPGTTGKTIYPSDFGYGSPGAFGPPSKPDRRKSGGIRTMDYSPLDQAWDAYYKSQRNTPSSSSSSMAFGVRGRASAVPQVGAPLNDSMQTDPVNRLRRGRLMKMPFPIRF